MLQILSGLFPPLLNYPYTSSTLSPTPPPPPQYIQSDPLILMYVYYQIYCAPLCPIVWPASLPACCLGPTAIFSVDWTSPAPSSLLPKQVLHSPTSWWPSPEPIPLYRSASWTEKIRFINSLFTHGSIKPTLFPCFEITGNFLCSWVWA